MSGRYFEIDGTTIQYFSEYNYETRKDLRGRYWLDKTRGVWNGPFRSKEDAYDDFKKDELLTRPV